MLPQKAARALAMVLLLILSGCTYLQKESASPPEIVLPEPDPAAAEPETQPSTPPATEVEEPEPQPQPPPQPEVIEPIPGRIAVVLSNRTPAYENVAIELGHLLDDYLLYNLADKSLSPERVFAGIADSDARVVIAIGFRAAEQAMALSSVPVVYCQVFNIDAADSGVPVKGISSIPPLALQVKAWKQLDPNINDIGAILGKGHGDLIAEAQRATSENDINLHYRVATSDRETLYIFNRMAPEIDGFWLFPDNRVLSVTILRKMLNYASRHDVQIAVFNTALLEMGAALSTTTVDADIAATAIAVADRIIAGDIAAIPARTTLHEVDVQTGSAVRPGAAGKGSR